MKEKTLRKRRLIQPINKQHITLMKKKNAPLFVCGIADGSSAIGFVVQR